MSIGHLFHAKKIEDEPPQGVTVPVHHVGRTRSVALDVCQVSPVFAMACPT